MKKLVLTTVPKSGSAWITSVIRDGTDLELFPLGARGNHPLDPRDESACNESLLRFLSSSATFYSHHVLHTERRERMIIETGADVVVLFRDPRDLIVSAYFASNRYTDLMNRLEVDAGRFAWRPLLDSIIRMKKWHLNTIALPWLRAGAIPLRYEDVIADPIEALASVLERIGVEADRDRIREAHDKIDARARVGVPSLHFRKGISGGWARFLSEEDLAEYHRELGREHEELGYA